MCGRGWGAIYRSNIHIFNSLLTMCIDVINYPCYLVIWVIVQGTMYTPGQELLHSDQCSNTNPEQSINFYVQLVSGYESSIYSCLLLVGVVPRAAVPGGTVHPAPINTRVILNGPDSRHLVFETHKTAKKFQLAPYH